MPSIKSDAVTLEAVQFDQLVHTSQWYAIRSEASVRADSRSAKKVTPEQHRIWWEASRAARSERRLFFIKVLLDQELSVAQQKHYRQTVGILRLDHRGSWTEVWLAIKPNFRGQHVGTAAVAQVVARFHEITDLRWPPLGAVVSTKKNAASWKLFVNAGFMLKKDGFVQLTSTKGF